MSTPPPAFADSDPAGSGAGVAVGPWRRLHPLSPLIRFSRSVTGLAVILGLGQIQRSPGSSGETVADLVLIGAVLAAGVVAWLVTRWRIEATSLRIDSGLFRRRSRQVPLSRLQAVDVVQPTVARFIGLAELRFRVAAGHSDVRLAFLGEREATALRAQLLAMANGLGAATPPPPVRPLVSVPTGRLVWSVALSDLGLVAVAVVLADAVLLATAPRAAAVGVAVTVAVLVGTVGPAVRRVTSEAGFALGEAPDGLRVRCGLLATVHETVPLRRIQAVRWIEPLLWRPFGWCRLEVVVAGTRGGTRRDEPSGRVVHALLPVGSRADAIRVLAQVLPGPGSGPGPGPGPGRGPGSGPRPGSGPGADPGRGPGSGPGPGAESPMGPVLRPPPARARWKAPLSWHFLAAGHDEELAVAQTGRVRRERIYVPLAKVQSLRFSEGPLQRRLRLATLHLDVAGRRIAVALRTRDRAEAEALLVALTAASQAARARERHATLPPPGAPSQPAPL